MNGLVSIIIPVYNRQEFIVETLTSIQKQTYTNWECIIVDDWSTDNSLKICKTFATSDTRFTVLERPQNRPKGANACRNYGFEKSRGVFINWFDSDDLMNQHFIKKKITLFGRNPESEGVISKLCVFSSSKDKPEFFENRTVITQNYLEDFITTDISWYLPDPMWKRSFLEGKNLFNEHLHKGQDRDFHTRLLLHHPTLKLCDEYLTYYRRHELSISKDLSPAVALSILNATLDRAELLDTLLTPRMKKYYFKSLVQLIGSLYGEPEIGRKYLACCKCFFTFDLWGVTWLLRLSLATAAYKLLGKGHVFVKESGR